MAQPGGPQPGQLPPGMQPPTPEQIEQMRRELTAEAEKAGVSVQEYVERLKQQAIAQHQAQEQQKQQEQHQHQHQHQQQQQQQQPIAPGPPKPEAIAMANFLKSQDLKPRTCIFQEKRRELFRVKRALRAIRSPAYQKARQKNPLLPEINEDRATVENAFKLLPMSLLALRVEKVPLDPKQRVKQKYVKGQWTVQIVQQQEAADDMHYMWLYETTSWKTQIYAGLALLAVFAVVMFPLWPIMLRQGVWYISMAMTGVLGLFFVMAIFRLILFLITMFAVPPGLWLYPNLFEDVGFFDSFKPLWAWHETPEEIKERTKAERKAKKARALARRNGTKGETNGKAIEAAADEPVPGTDSKESTSAKAESGAQGSTTVPAQPPMHASVEEAEDD